jgi:RNA recognition motif-containing protein
MDIPRVDRVDSSVSKYAHNSLAEQNFANHHLEHRSNVESSMVAQNNSLSYPPQTDSSSNLKLFVGGLYYQSEDEVLNFFKQYGEVVD